MSLRLARTRLCRGISQPRLRTPARRFYSSTATSSSAAAIKAGKYLAPAIASIGSGIWWLSDSPDEVPSLSGQPNASQLLEPGLSRDDVTRFISQGAYSFPVRNIANVTRYDGAQVASNSPCEDRFVHGKFASPWNDGSQWMAWAVFDGHAGWQTADLLEKQLLPAVRHTLSEVRPDARDESAVESAIMKAFVSLDDAIIQTASSTAQNEGALQEKVNKLTPGYAGSCALLSLYDPVSSTLYVACTGDSRAVLGKQKPDGTWEAIPLSVDQTGSNEDEIARLSKEHPGEENIAKKGRILGLMVSRAFGDGRWKWSLDLQKELQQRFNGPAPLTPRYDVLTPPYLTAEPVVTATKIDPNKPSVLIMATDGLWDTLSNQHAVNLTSKWLESDASGRKSSRKDATYDAFDFGQFKKGVDWRFVEERTTIQDDNAAVHLVRNSLGGNHHELVAGRLAYGPPFSRHLRDDITVQVVLFGNTSGPSSSR